MAGNEKKGPKIEQVDGHPFCKTSRAIGYYCEPGNKVVNAGVEFQGLGDSAKKAFNQAFGSWTQGNNKPKEKFHGWDKSEFGGLYSKCFVFKYVPDGLRIYGFLASPTASPRVQICCLVLLVPKREFKTDEKNLDNVEAIRQKTTTQALVDSYWSEINPQEEGERKNP